MRLIAIVAATVLFSLSLSVCAEDKKADSIYGFKMQDIDGKDVDLSKYKGKVVMVVNVASRCGLTPQYEALEKLYREKKDKGLVIL
jgi:glutathione peroxidase